MFERTKSSFFNTTATTGIGISIQVRLRWLWAGKKVAQSSNFQTSGIEVFKFVGKNTNKFNIKIKTVLFIEVFFFINIQNI